MKAFMFAIVLFALGSTTCLCQTITITKPQPGAIIRPNSTVTIEWTWNGVATNVNIMLEKPPGGSWSPLVTALPCRTGTNTWQWNIRCDEDVFLGTSRIEISKSGGGAVARSGQFVIGNPSGVLVLQSPANGTVAPGATVPITWTWSGSATNAAVHVIDDNGGSVADWTCTACNNGSNTLQWDVPTNIPSGHYCAKVVVIGQTHSSPGCVTVDRDAHATLTVQSPAGGEKWTTGSRHGIRWNWTGPSSTARIILLDGTGATMDITTGIQCPTGISTFDWPIPTNQPGRSDYRMRIATASGTTGEGGSFTIGTPANDQLVLDVSSPQPPLVGRGEQYKCTVSVHAGGAPIADASVTVVDPVAGDMAIKTGISGDIVYTRKVPQGRSDGSYQLRFNATKDGLQPSNEATAIIQVGVDASTSVRGVVMNDWLDFDNAERVRRPLSGATVNLYRGDEQIASTTTSGGGEFTFTQQWTDGPYTVLIKAPSVEVKYSSLTSAAGVAGIVVPDSLMGQVRSLGNSLGRLTITGDVLGGLIGIDIPQRPYDTYGVQQLLTERSVIERDHDRIIESLERLAIEEYVLYEYYTDAGAISKAGISSTVDLFKFIFGMLEFNDKVSKILSAQPGGIGLLLLGAERDALKAAIEGTLAAIHLTITTACRQLPEPTASIAESVFDKLYALSTLRSKAILANDTKEFVGEIADDLVTEIVVMLGTQTLMAVHYVPATQPLLDQSVVYSRNLQMSGNTQSSLTVVGNHVRYCHDATSAAKRDVDFYYSVSQMASAAAQITGLASGVAAATGVGGAVALALQIASKVAAVISVGSSLKAMVIAYDRYQGIGEEVNRASRAAYTPYSMRRSNDFPQQSTTVTYSQALHASWQPYRDSLTELGARLEFAQNVQPAAVRGLTKLDAGLNQTLTHALDRMWSATPTARVVVPGFDSMYTRVGTHNGDAALSRTALYFSLAASLLDSTNGSLRVAVSRAIVLTDVLVDELDSALALVDTVPSTALLQTALLLPVDAITIDSVRGDSIITLRFEIRNLGGIASDSTTATVEAATIVRDSSTVSLFESLDSIVGIAGLSPDVADTLEFHVRCTLRPSDTMAAGLATIRIGPTTSAWRGTTVPIVISRNRNPHDSGIGDVRIDMSRYTGSIPGIRPQPVRDRALVTMHLGTSCRISLTVVDQRGRTVMQVVDNEFRPAGDQAVALDAGRLPAGEYYLQSLIGNDRRTVPFVVVR